MTGGVCGLVIRKFLRVFLRLKMQKTDSSVSHIRFPIIDRYSHCIRKTVKLAHIFGGECDFTDVTFIILCII